MPVTQYYKNVKLTVVEAAVVYEALAVHSEKLAAMLNGELSALSTRNIIFELAAAQAAMNEISRAKVAAE